MAEQTGIANSIDTADQECRSHREQMVGKPVKETDDHQDQGIGYHDDLVSETVNDLSDQRKNRGKEHRR